MMNTDLWWACKLAFTPCVTDVPCPPVLGFGVFFVISLQLGALRKWWNAAGVLNIKLKTRLFAFILAFLKGLIWNDIGPLRSSDSGSAALLDEIYS